LIAALREVFESEFMDAGLVKPGSGVGIESEPGRATPPSRFNFSNSQWRAVALAALSVAGSANGEGLPPTQANTTPGFDPTRPGASEVVGTNNVTDVTAVYHGPHKKGERFFLVKQRLPGIPETPITFGGGEAQSAVANGGVARSGVGVNAAPPQDPYQQALKYTLTGKTLADCTPKQIAVARAGDGKIGFIEASELLHDEPLFASTAIYNGDLGGDMNAPAGLAGIQFKDFDCDHFVTSAEFGIRLKGINYNPLTKGVVKFILVGTGSFDTWANLLNGPKTNAFQFHGNEGPHVNDEGKRFTISLNRIEETNLFILGFDLSEADVFLRAEENNPNPGSVLSISTTANDITAASVASTDHFTRSGTASFLHEGFGTAPYTDVYSNKQVDMGVETEVVFVPRNPTQTANVESKMPIQWLIVPPEEVTLKASIVDGRVRIITDQAFNRPEDVIFTWGDTVMGVTNEVDPSLVKRVFTKSAAQVVPVAPVAPVTQLYIELDKEHMSSNPRMVFSARRAE